MEFDEVAEPVWNFIERNSTDAFNWVVTPSAQEKLRALLPDHQVGFFGKDLYAVNRQLRKVIEPELKNANDLAKKLAVWVIQDWGRIPRRDAGQIEAWTEELGTATPTSLNNFIAIRMRDRGDGVSSWSKLLAFAAPDTHAISDARTTIALNIALEKFRVRIRHSLRCVRRAAESQYNAFRCVCGLEEIR